MSLIKKHKWIVGMTLAGMAVAGIYSAVAPKEFEVSGTVVIHRQRVENPNTNGENEKNRWIWVRDGMGLKESLLSDGLWVSEIKENNLLRERYLHFLEKNPRLVSNARTQGASEEDLQLEFSQHLLKRITVDFTGGDSYSYVFRARDRDPHLAKALVLALIHRTETKVIQENQKAYQTSLAILDETISRTKSAELQSYLKNTARQLQVASILFDSSAALRMEVVRTPHIPLSPAWPRPKLLLLIALLFGITAGLGVEVCQTYLKTTHGKRERA